MFNIPNSFLEHLIIASPCIGSDLWKLILQFIPPFDD
jgi:hypothetical protein